MDVGRDMPGIRLSKEALQTICCRYYTAAQFVPGKQVLEVGCGAQLACQGLLQGSEMDIEN